MAMSKDRVHFTFPDGSSGNSENRSALAKAAREAFSLAQHELPYGRLVVCRPSQFARFLILRNKYGGANSFKELNPELVPSEQYMLDVSTRPNAVSPEC